MKICNIQPLPERKKEDSRTEPEQPARQHTEAAAHNKTNSAAVISCAGSFYHHLQIKYSLQIIQTRHKKEELLQLPFVVYINISDFGSGTL